MSHLTSGAIIIKDLDVARELFTTHPKFKSKCKWKEGQKTHRWYGRWANDYGSDDAAYKRYKIDPADYGKCDHAIEVEGSQYDIGLVKLKDGSGYALVWDFWSTGKRINDVIGAQAQHFLHEYNLAVTRKQAKQNGYAVKEQIAKDGKVQLVLSPIAGASKAASGALSYGSKWGAKK